MVGRTERKQTGKRRRTRTTTDSGRLERLRDVDARNSTGTGARTRWRWRCFRVGAAAGRHRVGSRRLAWPRGAAPTKSTFSSFLSPSQREHSWPVFCFFFGSFLFVCLKGLDADRGPSTPSVQVTPALVYCLLLLFAIANKIGVACPQLYAQDSESIPRNVLLHHRGNKQTILIDWALLGFVYRQCMRRGDLPRLPRRRFVGWSRTNQF